MLSAGVWEGAVGHCLYSRPMDEIEIGDPRLPAHFWAKVKPHPSGCWLWDGSCTQDGYGKCWREGRQWLAHRLAYTLLVGPIPDGLTIDHVKAQGCTHRHCVRPSHLEAVTMRVNLLRADTIPARNAAKTACPMGHPYDTIRNGQRLCGTCRRDRDREAKRAQRKAAR